MNVVLEEFDGFVDKIANGIAYITLTAKSSGEVFWGEYPALKLYIHGINERRKFKCRTVDADSGVEMEFDSIPDQEITEERSREIDAELEQLLGGIDETAQ